jgi:hypothetical protein
VSARRVLVVAAVAAAAGGALVSAPGAAAGDPPRYDVPDGYVKCPRAKAWDGFFKWASVRRTTCRRASRFMRAYGERAEAAGTMPRAVSGFRCRIRYWRNAEGDVYASRHSCVRDRAIVRFYGMV